MDSAISPKHLPKTENIDTSENILNNPIIHENLNTFVLDDLSSYI